MIEFEKVSRNYGAKAAVDGLELSIPKGEVFALLGPNGAGKTTTIKMLVGLLRPSAGIVRVCGHDVAQQTRLTNLQIGYVPDEPHLYDKLTGREFLQFVADMYGLDHALAVTRIESEIECFELGRFIDDLTESYSHGMKQRVVFAAALLHEPKVMVVDEPMVGLDPHNMRLVKDLVKLRADSGTSVFMSTHTLSVAEEVADRIGILNHGRLVFLGKLDELQVQLSMPAATLETLYLKLLDGAPSPECVSAGTRPGDVRDRDSMAKPTAVCPSPSGGSVPQPLEDSAARNPLSES